MWYCTELLPTKGDSTDKTSWLRDTIHFIVNLLTLAKVFLSELIIFHILISIACKDVLYKQIENNDENNHC